MLELFCAVLCTKVVYSNMNIYEQFLQLIVSLPLCSAFYAFFSVLTKVFCSCVFSVLFSLLF